MKLFEIAGSSYVVKKITSVHYEVAKFADHKYPETVYDVVRRGAHWWTTSPGFKHKAQEEKHILLVKRFIDDGEPALRVYQFDGDKIISNEMS